MPLDGTNQGAQAAMNSTPGGTTAQASAQQMNLSARQLIIGSAVDLWLPIASGTITTGPGSVVNVPVRPVGLLKRFLIKMTAPVTASAQNQSLGPFGPASLVSNVLFTDLSNQIRINTSGFHLATISTVKRRRVFGAAAVTDTPLGWGDVNTAVIQAPVTILATQTKNINMFFEVPVSYTDFDLRGTIYLGVTNATANLQFTLNNNMFANSGSSDATQAMYISAGANNATLGNVTWTVYQNVLDQLPRDTKTGLAIRPYLDESVAYFAQNTPQGGIVQNQDNPFLYPNFRDIMSTAVIYNNAGTLNVNGSDIDHFALESANFTNIWRWDPITAALMTRNIVGDDPPPGTYYFDHRHKPINTIQFGNMALIFNPSAVTTGASLLVFLEMLGTIGMVTQASSLSGT